MTNCMENYDVLFNTKWLSNATLELPYVIILFIAAWKIQAKLYVASQGQSRFAQSSCRIQKTLKLTFV